MLAAVFGLTGIASAQAGSASGTLTQNGKTVKLRSAIAVWDPAENELTIGLFPFAVNRSDVDTMRDSGALFVASGKPSPDISKWSSPPFAELTIEFAPGTHTISREKVAYYALHVSWLDKMNHTLSANRNYQEEVKREFSTLRGTTGSGGTVELSSRGVEQFNGGDRLSWDFRVQATLERGR